MEVQLAPDVDQTLDDIFQRDPDLCEQIERAIDLIEADHPKARAHGIRREIAGTTGMCWMILVRWRSDTWAVVWEPRDTDVALVVGVSLTTTFH